MKIGFIGLGRMGSGMAANLVKAGHDVTVHNRTAGKDAELVQMGARSAKTVEEACRGEAVVTMLANDEAVESVVYGGEGILVHLAKGATHVSCGTISVALAKRLTESHAAAGQKFVAGPVFGRPEAAA
jgi:3-hydroxyisobutyrate dehydrogenase-like beta-hydroxyacid dehydrogenase